MSNRTTDRLSRRGFLHAAAGAAALAAVPAPLRAAPAGGNKPERPNILFINTDQQHFMALSGHGNPYVRTPNMDRLLARGTTFMQSHSAHPVCGPARACLFTGRPSSELGVHDNSTALRFNIPNLRLWLRDRGYSEMYVGKYGVFYQNVNSHYPVAGHALGEFSDDGIAHAARAFLHNYDDDRPFFLSLGLHNPHDTCFWEMEYVQDIGTLPYPELADEIPPLPDNFDYDRREPETFASQRKGQMPKGWTELTWRYYLWSYYRMVEMVDAEVGRVLDALESSPFRDNTIVIFTSDHGEGLACHHNLSKWYLYDEALRVPLVVSWPGRLPEGVVDETHLVSGLDFAPTVCDFAGVEPMPGMRGASLRPLLEGKDAPWRDHLVCECRQNGRAVRTRDYKYIQYNGDPTVQLFDLRSDPGEKRNLAGEPAHASTREKLKALLDSYERGLKKLPPIRLKPA